MRSLHLVVLAAGALALHAASSFAQVVAPSPQPENLSLAPGLEIGTRMLHVVLDEDTRRGRVRPGGDPSKPAQRTGTFLGSLSELDVDQDYAPVRLYLQYFFTEYLGVGISYDEIRADTRDALGSDGFVGIDGPLLYLVGRLPTEYYFTPFAELGIGLYRANYDENAVWKQRGDVNERAMEVDDPTAFYIALGVDHEITEQWSFNLYFRSVFNATVDAEAYYPRQRNRVFARGEFPLDYYGFGVGLKYSFD